MGTARPGRAAGPAGVLVTGMQRSGTTLVEKLLCNHPDLSILSQPLPAAFIETKRAFLDRLGFRGEPYPLGNLFREERYEVASFLHFLEEFRLDRANVRSFFEGMSGFSGQYTHFAGPDIERFLQEFEPAGFAAALAGLYRFFAHRPEARLSGAKETICEEFLPYLVRRGWAAVVVVRDPRDVIASLDTGRGAEFAGRPKPLLFNLRNWRKSVAFALALDGQPGFVRVRYEDLVARPLDTLRGVTEALGLEPFPAGAFSGGIRDQTGALWEGNSSHGRRDGVSEASVGTQARLPAGVVRFIEAACLPELDCLGYPRAVTPAEAPAILDGFRQAPDAITGRPGMAAYADFTAVSRAERRRLELLANASPEESERFFILPGVRERLAAARPR